MTDGLRQLRRCALPRAVMILAILVAPSTARAQSGDAYLDEDAREMVRLARLRLQTVDRRIESYGTTARERFSVSLRAGIAEKLAYRRETVTRIEWRKDGPLHMDILAMREVSPLFDEKPEVPDDLSAELLSLAFDPADPSMLLRVDTTAIRHPLADGGEAHYRFASGDTTLIRLPDGRTVRLRELRIIPRRRQPLLINGSFWLDASTHAVVQAYFRLARAFDADYDNVNAGVTVQTSSDSTVARDSAAMLDLADPDSPAVADTTARRTRSISLGDMPGFLRPIRADIDFIAIEYGLWDLHWWLPRLVAVRGYVQVSRFRVPLTYERTYEDYTVHGDTSGVLVVDADSLPRTCRARVRYAISPDNAAVDSARQARIDTARERRQLLADERRAQRGDTVAVEECDREVVISAPADSVLLNSPELPESAYAGDVELIRDDELSAIVDRAASIADAPWQLAAPRLQWFLQGPGLLRYNRVEGLSLGGRMLFDLGPATLDVQSRIGHADLDPRGEIALHRQGGVVQSRFAAYRRLQSTTPSPSTHGTFATLGALLLGRDDEQYFDALGTELVLRPPESRPQWYDLRMYMERQAAVERNTSFSIAHLINDANSFGGNFTADAADQLGARLRLRAAYGTDPGAPRVAGELSLGGETGTFSIVRPEALLRVTTPVAFGAGLSVEAAAGTVEGSNVPLQANWWLGGASTLRGYSGGVIAGERYWRTRAELGWGVTGARLTLFSDAGWAGPRNRFDADGALVSAGAGISLLDDVFRVDLARGLRAPRGWRLHVHFSGME